MLYLLSHSSIILRSYEHSYIIVDYFGEKVNLFYRKFLRKFDKIARGGRFTEKKQRFGENFRAGIDRAARSLL